MQGVISSQTTIRVPGNTSSAVIGGLLPGEDYLFKVSAVVVANGTEMAGNVESYSLAGVLCGTCC